ncbi:hypothetical protein PV325_010198, partial [Microctonus aethiopoides]
MLIVRFKLGHKFRLGNGIKNLKKELEEMLSRLRIDVCLVTETKLSTTTDKSSISNYSCFKIDRTTSKHGGGVIILVNKKYNKNEIPVNSYLLPQVKTIDTVLI